MMAMEIMLLADSLFRWLFVAPAKHEQR